MSTPAPMATGENEIAEGEEHAGVGERGGDGDAGEQEAGHAGEERDLLGGASGWHCLVSQA
ncbi:hypothetical protein [Micromonospora kangleipakensis]|uniref:hypothetical protein n=1 Tax=Micromonospora kangleipakensis TaxID=1077942 RepID=UPI00102930D7|nr:hypothetical protein [Micromonospora kangleipakensis]